MIPLRMQKGLIDRLEKLFEEKEYQRPAKDDESSNEKHFEKMKIYNQHLPIKETADDVYVPFTLVQMHTGKQANSKSKNIVNVSLIIGMYDEFNSTGYQEVALTINTIINNLKSYPLIEDMFELDLEEPIEWEIGEEETYPFYFGGLNVNFKMPIIEFGQRYDLEGLI